MKETFSAYFEHSFSLGILSHLDEPLKTDEMGEKERKIKFHSKEINRLARNASRIGQYFVQ